MEKDKSLPLLLLVLLLALDCAVWFRVLGARPPAEAVIQFLDVGQGDATLLTLAGGIQILTDAGPGAAVARQLEQVMPAGDKYIDIAVITHPETDHFGGFSDLLDQGYGIGVFIVNGRDRADSRRWQELLAKVSEQGTPVVILAAGDAIYHDRNRIDVLSPGPEIIGSSELNDTALVTLTRTPEFSALLTGDIGANVENILRRHYDLRADILKTAHHGSKYSSSLDFLRAVRPAVAVVSAGARNRYGHPAPEALARLAAVGAAVFRTDEDGAVTVRREEERLRAFKRPSRPLPNKYSN